jgi:hypothetical protein
MDREMKLLVRRQMIGVLGEVGTRATNQAEKSAANRFAN